MSTLTVAQAYRLAVEAGFTGSSAVTAAAIAGAESGYRTDAIGDRNLTRQGEQSVGLWQINYRPDRDANNPTRDPRANLDPRANAAAAFEISGGGKNFTPWSTYTNGAYRQYMYAALAASHAAGDNPALPQVTAPDAGGGTSSSSSSGDAVFVGGGLNWNPLDGFGIKDALVGGIAKLVLPAIFVLAGVTLAAGGVYKAVTSKTGKPSIPPAAAVAAL